MFTHITERNILDRTTVEVIAPASEIYKVFIAKFFNHEEMDHVLDEKSFELYYQFEYEGKRYAALDNEQLC